MSRVSSFAADFTRCRSFVSSYLVGIVRGGRSVPALLARGELGEIAVVIAFPVAEL